MEYQEPLRLGRNSAFVKSTLRNLPQTDDVWQVDFEPVPEQVCKRVDRAKVWLGLVVSAPRNLHLANMLLEVPPATVNDLARLLAQAMNRPLVDRAHRPARIHLRGRRPWNELLPHLEQLGIEVVIQDLLPTWDAKALEFFQGMRALQVGHGGSVIALPLDIEQTHPTLACWVQEQGSIEIGKRGPSGFVVRATTNDSVIFENRECRTMSEGLGALEEGLAQWLEEEGGKGFG